MKAFHDPDEFPFSMALEAACEAIRAEVLSLSPDDFVDWPEALTTARDGYDESGWRFFGLFSSHDQDVHELYDLDANRRRCPETVRACAAIPGMTDAGFSAFLPGTHLWPHRGELAGLLRCHLPLVVAPTGQGLKVGGETRAWQQGRCLVFDDRVQHEAWNHASTTRIVLIVTFRWPQTSV
ncbi:MAG: aspartyl/asparaginyl beta-hydroxylase domain-containing protein [Planctomycetes bacterium]|nr:aspartyl/asparaginyl beta-hydroxylase domain-containing protein [Planctomycetota bacterium]